MIRKKSAKGDLESRRSTFLTLGVVLVVGLVYLGFELYATQSRSSNLVFYEPDIPELTDEVIPTDQLKTPPPPPPQVQLELKIVKELVTDPIDLSDLFPEYTPDETIPEPVDIEFIPEPTKDDIPKSQHNVDVQPEFPGGMEGLYKFLNANLTYPKVAKELGLTGVVVVEFIIEHSGKPSNIRIVSASTGEVFNAEAIRIINEMPNWKPGMHHGKTVRTIYQLPIQFVLR